MGSTASREPVLSYQELFDGLDKLARHGFEFFLAALGALLMILGLAARPGGALDGPELWLISAFGFLCLLASLYVWRQKAQQRFRSQELKIAARQLATELRARCLPASGAARPTATTDGPRVSSADDPARHLERDRAQLEALR